MALRRQPIGAMRTDLLELFDVGELRKYMTEEELAGLPGADCRRSQTLRCGGDTFRSAHWRASWRPAGGGPEGAVKRSAREEGRGIER